MPGIVSLLAYIADRAHAARDRAILDPSVYDRNAANCVPSPRIAASLRALSRNERGWDVAMAGVPREQWTTKRGFILAAIGSAVGLGNMWRFSYLAAENGGAAFVILYLAATLVVGLPVLLAELVLGR